VNARRVKAAVDSAEHALDEALALLRMLKDPGQDTDCQTSPHRFQMAIAEVLLELGEVKAEVSADKRELIGRKQKLNETWFASRMRALSDYSSVLDRTAGILRNVGDAFAWLFYFRNPWLLRSHWGKPPQPLPTGVGGKAEVEFLRQVPSVAELFVVSHLATSILRVGDVSLIDPATGDVVALGELKTILKSKDEAVVRLDLVGHQEAARKRLDAAISERSSAIELQHDRHVPQPIQARLDRQVREMAAAITPNMENDLSATLQQRFYTKELGELAVHLGHHSWGTIKASPGVLLAAIRLDNRRNLWSRLTCGIPPTAHARVEKIAEETVGVIDKRSKFNSLHYGFLDGSPFPGGTPAWWWPVDKGFLEDVYLGRVLVMVMFNPATLIARLLDAGLTCVDTATRNPIFRKRAGKGEIAIGGFQYWIFSVVHHLASEDLIFSTIRQSIEALEESNLHVPARFNIRPNLFVL